MLNFELKTRIINFSEILEKMYNIGAVYKETMNQTDYYFKIGTEKEKIREINHQKISFISYKRSEKRGRKDSNYTIETISQEQKKSLLEQKPLLCLVDKVRHLWIYKNTRIHLDSVVGLGNFMELETVVKGISKNEGAKEFKEVVNKLKIKKTEPFSYSDLILNQSQIATG